MNAFFGSRGFFSKLGNISSNHTCEESIETSTTMDTWELVEDDMSLYDGLYKLTVKHNLNTKNIVVTANNNGVPVNIEYKRVIDKDTIEVYIEEPTDCKLIITESVPEDFVEGIAFRPFVME